MCEMPRWVEGFGEDAAEGDTEDGYIARWWTLTEGAGKVTVRCGWKGRAFGWEEMEQGG
jgi:hypothetical protein